jgi:hypothetical protein
VPARTPVRIFRWPRPAVRAATRRGNLGDLRWPNNRSAPARTLVATLPAHRARRWPRPSPPPLTRYLSGRAGARCPRRVHRWPLLPERAAPWAVTLAVTGWHKVVAGRAGVGRPWQTTVLPWLAHAVTVHRLFLSPPVATLTSALRQVPMPPSLHNSSLSFLLCEIGHPNPVYLYPDLIWSRYKCWYMYYAYNLFLFCFCEKNWFTCGRACSLLGSTLPQSLPKKKIGFTSTPVVFVRSCIHLYRTKCPNAKKRLYISSWISYNVP